MSFHFDKETAIDQTGESTSTNLSTSWSIGDNPNGGYAMASSLRAMASDVANADETAGSTTKSDPVSLTAHFLRPSLAGQPGTINHELIRSGRRTSTASASLIQDGSERIRLLAAFADLGAARSQADQWETEPKLSIEPAAIASPEDCRDRSKLEQGVELPILSRLDVRIDPRFAEPGAAGVAECAGWIRFADGREPDSLALTLFADAFPPALYSLLGRVGWVPTVELTVHVRSRPAPGWIRARFTTRDLTDGLLVEDGELWDSEGTLVAQTRQLALLLPPGT